MKQLHRDRKEKTKLVESKQSICEASVQITEEGLISQDMKEGTVVERRGDRVLVEVASNASFLSSLNTTIATIDPETNRSYVVALQKAYLSEMKVVVGDKVNINLSNKDQPLVTSVKERTNVLERAIAGRGTNKLHTKTIVSNIDQILIVVSIIPQVPTGTIDRFIVAAIEFGIPDVKIVVNKADLGGSLEYYDSLQHYNSLGYEVLKTSTEGANDMIDLITKLQGKTSVFVGQSGVGKSSLIKALIPEVQIAIGELGGVGKNIGAHTTSNAKLYHLDHLGFLDDHDLDSNKEKKAGQIVDSPGIREFGIWHLSRDSIREGFIEIDKYASRCKFRNCKHTEGEDGPNGGCAVRAAVRNGDIHPLRFESYQYLLR